MASDDWCGLPMGRNSRRLVLNFAWRASKSLRGYMFSLPMTPLPWEIRTLGRDGTAHRGLLKEDALSPPRIGALSSLASNDEWMVGDAVSGVASIAHWNGVAWSALAPPNVPVGVSLSSPSLW